MSLDGDFLLRCAGEEGERDEEMAVPPKTKDTESRKVKGSQRGLEQRSKHWLCPFVTVCGGPGEVWQSPGQ